MFRKTKMVFTSPASLLSIKNLHAVVIGGGGDIGSNVTMSNNMGIVQMISQGSNLGIGTLLPQFTLDVTGNINFTGSLTSNGIPYVSGTSNAAYWSSNTVKNIIYPSGNTAALSNVTSITFSNSTAMPFISSYKSNIGINNPTPSNALDIIGNLSVSGTTSLNNINVSGILTTNKKVNMGYWNIQSFFPLLPALNPSGSNTIQSICMLHSDFRFGSIIEVTCTGPPNESICALKCTLLINYNNITTNWMKVKPTEFSIFDWGRFYPRIVVRFNNGFEIGIARENGNQLVGTPNMKITIGYQRGIYGSDMVIDTTSTSTYFIDSTSYQNLAYVTATTASFEDFITTSSNTIYTNANVTFSNSLYSSTFSNLGNASIGNLSVSGLTSLSNVYVSGLFTASNAMIITSNITIYNNEIIQSNLTVNSLNISGSTPVYTGLTIENTNHAYNNLSQLCLSVNNNNATYLAAATYDTGNAFAINMTGGFTNTTPVNALMINNSNGNINHNFQGTVTASGGNVILGTYSAPSTLTLSDVTTASWQLNTTGYKLNFNNNNSTNNAFTTKMYLDNNGNISANNFMTSYNGGYVSIFQGANLILPIESNLPQYGIGIQPNSYKTSICGYAGINFNIDSQVPFMKITNAKTVGIGLAQDVSPQNTLHIANLSSTQLLITNYTGGGGSKSGIQMSTFVNQSNAPLIQAIDDNAYGGHISFSTGTGQSLNLNERVRITNNGNVGIGTSNPTAKLDVNGNINFTGSLTSNGVPYGNELSSGPVGINKTQTMYPPSALSSMDQTVNNIRYIITTSGNQYTTTAEIWTIFSPSSTGAQTLCGWGAPDFTWNGTKSINDTSTTKGNAISIRGYTGGGFIMNFNQLVILNGYTFQLGYMTTSLFTYYIFGSIDNYNWTKLHSNYIATANANQQYTYSFTNTTGYQYYAFLCTKMQSDGQLFNINNFTWIRTYELNVNGSINFTGDLTKNGVSIDNRVSSIGGLFVTVYDDSLNNLGDFNLIFSGKPVYSVILSSINYRDFYNLFKNFGLYSNISMKWTGYIKVPTTDTYTFGIGVDDKFELYVNQTFISSSYIIQGLMENAYTGSISLLANVWYPFCVHYLQREEGCGLIINWKNTTTQTSYVNLAHGQNGIVLGYDTLENSSVQFSKINASKLDVNGTSRMTNICITNIASFRFMLTPLVHIPANNNVIPWNCSDSSLNITTITNNGFLVPFSGLYNLHACFATNNTTNFCIAIVASNNNNFSTFNGNVTTDPAVLYTNYVATGQYTTASCGGIAYLTQGMYVKVLVDRDLDSYSWSVPKNNPCCFYGYCLSL